MHRSDRSGNTNKWVSPSANCTSRSSTSSTWQSPQAKMVKERQALNQLRRKICKNSPFWTADFDREQHERDWEAGKAREAQYRAAAALDYLGPGVDDQDTPFPPTSSRLRPAFDGKEFETPHSNVLSHLTIFCPQYETDREEVAPWPNRMEMKYEGDDRIATDRLHGRFPGAPRVPGNDTVNWQHKAIIVQFPFDDFLFPLPTEVDIWMRQHVIEDLQFSDVEAEAVLGKDLMRLLDPQDQFLE